jgi:hypothetical protein
VNPYKMWIIGQILLVILTHVLAFWLGGFFPNSDCPAPGAEAEGQ